MPVKLCGLCYTPTPDDEAFRAVAPKLSCCIAGTPVLAARVKAAAPGCPVYLYTNATNIYDDLLADWLGFAATRRLDPEQVFLHSAYPGAEANRLHYPGQPKRPRYLTDPSSAGLRLWLRDYWKRLKALLPALHSDGIHLDNTNPRLAASAVEATDFYAEDQARLIADARGHSGMAILANTAAYSGTPSDALAAASGMSYEEFLLRPLGHDWKRFLAAADLVRGRLARGGTLTVLDSHLATPAGHADPFGPRTRLALLACYLIVADPPKTALGVWCGNETTTSWARHWFPALDFDPGLAVGPWSVLAAGADPALPGATYNVYRRDWSRCVALHKPLSWLDWSHSGSLGDDTGTTHDLGGSFAPLRDDGTAGDRITSVTLRNGEGAVLLR